MDRRLVIFAGAGASYGVSANKYPMTKQFFEKLPTDVTSPHLFTQVKTFIEKQRGKAAIDIEDILWILGDLSGAIEKATSKESFLRYLLTSNQISAITSDQHSGPGGHGQLVRLGQLVKSLQDSINTQVYRYYNTLPSKEELQRSWLPLLRWSRGLNPSAVDVFTTNYDRVIESALDEITDIGIETGKRAGVEVSIDVSLWDRSRNNTPGLLTKLHGSVDWKFGEPDGKGGRVVRWGHPEHDGKHDDRGIIYPGFKGRPETEPFRSFHDYLRRTSAVATHLVFIGFAFRDEFINELLASSLSPTAKIAVIDPAEGFPAQVPFLASAQHIRQGFGDKNQGLVADAMGTPPWLDEIQTWVA